jgi:hypothetical protein
MTDKPSALQLGSAAIDALNKKNNLGILRVDNDGLVRGPADKRDAKVPVGMKKVYHQGQPHQGKKEMARRAKQLEKLKEKGK